MHPFVGVSMFVIVTAGKGAVFAPVVTVDDAVTGLGMLSKTFRYYPAYTEVDFRSNV